MSAPQASYLTKASTALSSAMGSPMPCFLLGFPASFAVFIAGAVSARAGAWVVGSECLPVHGGTVGGIVSGLFACGWMVRMMVRFGP
jgi:hypothetical protein